MERQSVQGQFALFEGAQGSFRFKREEHLKGRKEIQAVFSRGKRFGWRSAGGSGGVKLFVLKNSLPHNRICFTFSRGFGNAVERNRARRLGREAWRYLKPRLACGYDMVLLVYPAESMVKSSEAAAKSPQAVRTKARKSGFAVRTEQMTFLFSKAGLLK